MVPQGITRVVVKERDRVAAAGHAAGRRLPADRRSLHGDRPARPHRDLASRHPPAARRGPRAASRGASSPRIGSPRSKGCIAWRCSRRNSSPSKNLVLRVGRFRAAPAGRRCVRRRNARGRHRDGAARRRHDGVSADAEGRTRPAEVVRRHRIARDAVHLRVRAHQPVRVRAARRPATCSQPVALDSRAYRRGLAVFDDGRAEVVQPRPQRLEPRRLVAAAAARRLRRRGQDAPLRRPHLRAIERRGRRRHVVPPRRASATSAPTRRSRSCRAAGASTTRTTTSITTSSTTTSMRRSIPSATGWKARRG